MKLRRLTAVLAFLLCACTAQQGPQHGTAFVEFVPSNTVVVNPRKPAPVEFTFHIRDPYHINSNKPLSQELIPTQIHFSLPGDLTIGKVLYPSGTR